MNSAILPGYLPPEQRGDRNPHFKYAVIAAVLVELGIVFGLMSIPQAPPTPKPVVLPRPVVHRPAPVPIQPLVPPQPQVVHRPPPPVPVPPAPVTPPPPISTPAPPAPVPVSGIGAYGAGARSLVKQNIHISAIIKRLYLHGTVMVSFKVPPGGGTARVVDGTDNPLIRRAALHALSATAFPAYTSTMPDKTLTFTVPIEIS